MRVMVLTALAAALLYLGACASFPLFGMRNSSQGETGQTEATSSSVTMELQNIDYDGVPICVSARRGLHYPPLLHS